MITFEVLRWKNLLSTGNTFTELKLNGHNMTLVVGANGDGKSTMLDALCFGLFNKPFRNIKKGQLVNSINKKNCVVEIEFAVGKRKYKVVRGINPNGFEIWQDKVLLNQDASVKDYQEYLEDTILKLNYKSFTQIVILGSASFVPFMKLPAIVRRELIEDILDIRIFTTMNLLLKDQIVVVKAQIQQIENDLLLSKERTKMQDKYIKSLQADRKERIDEIEKQISEVTKEVIKIRVDKMKSSMAIENLDKEIQDSKRIDASFSDVSLHIASLKSRMADLRRDIEFYRTENRCPTCKQELSSEFKETTIEEKIKDCNELSQRLILMEESLGAIRNRQDEIEDVIALQNSHQKEIDVFDGEISGKERFIQTLTVEQSNLEKKVSNTDTEKVKLKEMAKEVVQLSEQRAKINEEKHYMDIASTLLKDSGIKTQIIKQYLPPINKLVNKFLKAMDFFVHFELDEEFKEVIKSRHRDEFSYESFSEGEKQRIDLALLFTWRTIAKMKNSASTNLLILDEVFDSSLDVNGTDYVMSLLNTLGEQTNVWVISHKGDQLTDKFSNTVKFVKQQNYSVVGK